MKEILIVSADDILLYQPTILNLYDYLKDYFNVRIISFEPKFLGKKKDISRNIIYLSTGKLINRILRLADLIVNAPLKRVDKFIFPIKFRAQFVRNYKYRILLCELKKHKPEHVIAVDFMPLYAAQKVFGKANLLSLEILPYDPFRKLIDEKKIASLIIQNEERAEYLFSGIDFKIFYLQNAPLCSSQYFNAGRREGLIWAGTITKIFSVFECINFIKAFPEFSLVLKGAIPLYTKNEIEMNYKELITSGRIVIDSEYLSAPEYIKYVSNFRIGFCFYDWNLIKNDFNYQTAPSGKLFVYLSAGLPVIVCNIPGFKFIEDYQAGILINDYKPETILNAIKIIEANYSLYQNNCYRAFNDFCFNKNVEAFKLFLLMDD